MVWEKNVKFSIHFFIKKKRVPEGTLNFKISETTYELAKPLMKVVPFLMRL
jgi:hypothetical protein